MDLALPSGFSKSNQAANVALPVVMGILNVTPDSFSDGGQYYSIDSAVKRAKQMVEQGAQIIDVGGESTRPGAEEMPAPVQIERVVPVIEAIRASCPNVSISVDTRIATVANSALSAGATIVNDISALRDDPAMVDLVVNSGAGVILMHRRGIPLTMQRGGGPVYEDVVSEVVQFLLERARFAESTGVDPSRITLDPGIGFGKRVEDNLLLMRHLSKIVDLGWPVLVGASRKSFLGAKTTPCSFSYAREDQKPTKQSESKDRLASSLACAVWAADQGAAIVRVHDVCETLDALSAWQAIALAS